jgi:site-specific DNA-methyltransferase (cytosine-N4-specific)
MTIRHPVIDPKVSAHYTGDVRALLKRLPDRCVQCCVTSPPYWGLRSYLDDDDPMKELEIGLEDTPEEYVAVMVEVFEEVRRVLRDDGTLWLNLGDCYVTNPRGPGGAASSTLTGSSDSERRQKRWEAAGRKGMAHPNNRTTDPKVKGRSHASMASRGLKSSTLKHKDLVGIPWMTAFALRDAGWYLRMDNIWSKPNPMPESVTDRTTKSHEYLFHLSKGESYYYNDEAIAETSANAGRTISLGDKSFARGQATGARRKPTGNGTASEYEVGDTRNKRSVWTVRDVDRLKFAEEQATVWAAVAAYIREHPHGKHSVWTVTPQPYAGAHFATFPPDLIEPCILACSRPGDLVLDPFFGSGTTGQVAEKHERIWIGFDINPKYAELAKERTAQRSLPLSR